MAVFYEYLISSLPMLHFGGRPPFSFEKFLSTCENFIPGSGLAQIRDLAGSDLSGRANQMVERFLNFDTVLKNELVKLRVLRKKAPAEKYLRPNAVADSAVYHLALAAQRNPSLRDAEFTLDEARWNFLEGLAFGHYFDLEFLIIYALKLLILERWEKIHQADGKALLQNLTVN